MTLLVIYATLFFSLGLDVGNRKQLGKWFQISVLNEIVLELEFTNEFVWILSIKVDYCWNQAVLID